MQQSRFIQGNLQAIFDALFFVGAIDPMLQSNWEDVKSEIKDFPRRLDRAIETINQCQGNTSNIVKVLQSLEKGEIQILTMEVGRELAEFADRRSLH